MYALHDALVKPMPGNHMTPSLAESWTVSPDQRVYEFKLREGPKFHNGEPFTAEDVKFSFQRAKTKILKEKVREVVVVDPHRALRLDAGGDRRKLDVGEVVRRLTKVLGGYSASDMIDRFVWLQSFA